MRVKTMLRLGVVLGALLAAPAASAQDAATSGCAAVSPIAAPCVGAAKIAESLAAECRRLGLPEASCGLPFSAAVSTASRDAYVKSWTHRAAGFQSALGDAVPLLQAAFLGTHNSFNSVNDTPTISHSDSNQQLSLVQQLDVDMRSLELDLHFFGGRVVLCHARPASEAHAGCTTERTFAEVLPEVGAWLRANPDEFLLLYLEDALKADAGYAEAVAALDRELKRADGSSMVLKPDPAALGDKGCAPLPLDRSRTQIKAAGAQVVIVGNCAKGWGSRVFEWNSVHVESGDAAKYKPFPACDGTYPRSVYTSKLVRYFEDSTLIATIVDPTRPVANPEALTPERVAQMTACGATIFGFDQLLPGDGRIAASLWSWATDEPKLRTGCALQGRDGRWTAVPCTQRHRVACASKGTWSLSARAVAYKDAARACRKARRGPYFALPMTGNSNAQLRRTAGEAPVWIRYKVGASKPAAP